MQRLPRKVLKHGFALHETFAYHFDQKKRDGKGLKLKEAQEFFADVFQSGLEDYGQELQDARFLLSKEYLAKEKEVDVGELLSTGAKGIEVYLKEMDPKISPDLVEADFSIPVVKGVQLIGKIDLTDTKDVIHEMKTTRKSPNKQDIRSDAQLAIYQLGFQSITKRLPKGISKDYIVMSKKDPKIVRFQVARPFLDRKAVLGTVVSILSAMRNNIFYCLHPAESWICSKEWCGYYGMHKELRKLGLQRFIQKYSKK
ncbi:MAG: PD-(D/E)XK nuclease family protein [Candidatus Wildermuthbacteria bacterium]|nr:PD-(D/E)XK nuclease family protein [Candidatus Wildermuthbacteria bacterium]